METLSTALEKCAYCGEQLSDYTRDTKVTVYTRDGPLEAVHVEARCKDKSCRIAYRYGYHLKEGIIYDDDVLKKKYIVTSRYTAFETIYLFEIVQMVFFGTCSFSAITSIYNALHWISISRDIERYSMYEKRVSRAFFVFALLDIKRRYHIPITFDTDSVDTTLKKHYEELHVLIQKEWGSHQCEVPGCGVALVIDGGLKPQRKICGARTAGVYKYKHSSNHTMVGCTRIPRVGEKFCAEHLSSNVPSIPANKLTFENVKKLRKSVRSVKTERTDEDIFNVEGLHGKRKSKNGELLYLVQWQGYSTKTWEKETNIPKYIRDFYDRTGKSEIPKPRIKSVKKAGSAVYYLLSWDGTDAPEELVPQEDFNFDDEEAEESSCNTQKHHGAKMCHTSAGILIGCSPCGVIPLFEELFGSESKSQVFSYVTDFLGEVNPKSMEYLIYDDACHLGPYATNYSKSKKKTHTEATKKMAALKHVVDKLHFKGHVGSWCHKHCNPYSVPALKDVNTVICEQSFRWVNKYVNVKAMNEYRFRVYFTYLIDLHNLNQTGKLHLAHPTGCGTKAVYENVKQTNTKIRCELCGKDNFGTKKPLSGLTRHMNAVHGGKGMETDMRSTRELNRLSVSEGGEGKKIDAANTEEFHQVSTSEESTSQSDPITEMLQSLALGSNKPSGPGVNSSLTCEVCGKNDFKNQSGMTRHMKSIHKTRKSPENSIKCLFCDKFCTTKSGLTRHNNIAHPSSFNTRNQ